MDFAFLFWILKIVISEINKNVLDESCAEKHTDIHKVFISVWSTFNQHMHSGSGKETTLPSQNKTSTY